MEEADILVLGAEPYDDDEHINLKEVVLKTHNPWTGLRIRDLDISRQSIIVLVKRRNKSLIPNGNMKLEAATEYSFIRNFTCPMPTISRFNRNYFFQKSKATVCSSYCHTVAFSFSLHNTEDTSVLFRPIPAIPTPPSTLISETPRHLSVSLKSYRPSQPR